MNQPSIDFGWWGLVVGPGAPGTTPLEAAQHIRRAFDYLIPQTADEALRPTEGRASAYWFTNAIATRARCSWAEASDVCAEVIPEAWPDMWIERMEQNNGQDSER